MDGRLRTGDIIRRVSDLTHLTSEACDMYWLKVLTTYFLLNYVALVTIEH